MTSTHVAALALAVLIDTGPGLACHGWGRLCRLAFRVDSGEAPAVSHTVWFGWAACRFVFQAIHLFMALDVYAVLPGFGHGHSPANSFLLRLRRPGELASGFKVVER